MTPTLMSEVENFPSQTSMTGWIMAAAAGIDRYIFFSPVDIANRVSSCTEAEQYWPECLKYLHVLSKRSVVVDFRSEIYLSRMDSL